MNRFSEHKKREGNLFTCWSKESCDVHRTSESAKCTVKSATERYHLPVHRNAAFTATTFTGSRHDCIKNIQICHEECARAWSTFRTISAFIQTCPAPVSPADQAVIVFPPHFCLQSPPQNMSKFHVRNVDLKHKKGALKIQQIMIRKRQARVTGRRIGKKFTPDDYAILALMLFKRPTLPHVFLRAVFLTLLRG